MKTFFRTPLVLTVFCAAVIAISFFVVKTQAEDPTLNQPVGPGLPTGKEVAALPKDGGEKFNRLIFEKSPYLLQHAKNPVDWWPWNKEAFKKAKEENKPVLLSVGYTTCHWCHVMEHESFEDRAVAKLLNEKFIAIKVDREERPDIDEVYMAVTVAMNRGNGGWPMNVIMTPDKKPFFAGTYFPKTSRGGRIGFIDLLERLSDAWETDKVNVVKAADDVANQLQDFLQSTPGGPIPPEIFDKGFEAYFTSYDDEHGGFRKGAPKFPVPQNLMFLLRYHQQTGDANALEMVEKTLTEMRRGGMYDHVGFGTHRYSTDRIWLVPHFEKMLYDQALLAIANLEAFQVTGKEKYARTAREIFTYVLRDMTSVNGGFYSAEDADSEGEEGTFYVWTAEEVNEVLGPEDGDFFASTFNFTPGGNFLEEATGEPTGTNIPHLRKTLNDEHHERVEKLRQKLFAHREDRIHPQKDDKILTDWNGLMIAAFAKAAQVLGDEEYQTAAENAAEFVHQKLTTEDGRLLKRYRQGEAGLTAHLEDYAFMTWGLLDLYETTFDVKYLQRAVDMTEVTIANFWDPKDGGFYMTANDSETLIVRAKKLIGGAIPSGNGVSMLNLARLYRLTGDTKYSDKADELSRAFSETIVSSKIQVPLTLSGLMMHFGPSHEVLISADSIDSDDSKAMISALRKPFLPNKVVMFRTSENVDALKKLASFAATMSPINEKATAYVCQKQTCQLPTNEIEKMLESLKKK